MTIIYKQPNFNFDMGDYHVVDLNSPPWDPEGTPFDKFIKFLNINDPYSDRRIREVITVIDGSISIEFTIIKIFLPSFPDIILLNLRNANISLVIGTRYGNMYDPYTVEIRSFSKSKEYSGSTLMTFLIKFIKSFDAKRITLVDVTTVPCGNDEINLLFLDLVRYGKTWYEKFGFRPGIHNVGMIKDNYEMELKKYDTALKNFREMPLAKFEKNLQEMADTSIQIIINFEIDNTETAALIRTNAVKRDELLLIFNISNRVLELIHRFKNIFKSVNIENVSFKEFVSKMYDDDCQNFIIIYGLFDVGSISWMNQKLSTLFFRYEKKMYEFCWMRDVCTLGNVVGQLSYTLDLKN